MSEVLVAPIILFAVLVIAVVLFGLWLIASILRLVGRGFLALVGTRSPAAAPGLACQCPRKGCHAVNPSTARFCRRCGQELLKYRMASGHSMRRAALW